VQEFCVTRLNEDGRSLNEEVAFEIFDATGNDGPASLDFVDFGFDYNELVKKRTRSWSVSLTLHERAVTSAHLICHGWCSIVDCKLRGYTDLLREVADSLWSKGMSTNSLDV